jgi:L-ribulokinase
MGTSTCDMLVVPAAEFQKKQIIGICGQVPDSIIPGMIGMEAGQSAFGDVYNWFSKFLLAPLGWLGISNDATPESLLNILSEKAASLNLDEWRQLPLSTDWFNGRRSPDVQPLLKAAITGLELATDPVMVFASLVESTCFGSRAIVERFVDSGIPVKGIIGLGGIAHKSSFVMQRMADILNRPIKCNRANQCCALGAAMFAATQAGWYENIEVAMQQMGQGLLTTYLPNTDAKWRNVIEERYQRYKQLGYFIEQEAAKELAVSLH